MDGRKLFGAFTIAIALFFFWPAVVGGWQQVSALRAAVAERELLLESRMKLLASVQTAYGEYQTKLSQQDGQKFAALVPVRKNAAEIISAVEEIGSNTGMTVTEISMSESKSKTSTQFKTLSMKLETNGSYDSLRSFLSGLEQYVRLLNVASIDASVDTRAFSTLRFSIQADAYFLQ